MRILIIIFTLCFTSYCSAQFVSYDDRLHFGAGAVISAGTYTVVYLKTKDKKKAFWYSLGTSVLAGVAKEVRDSGQKNNIFDTGEIVATALGGLTASTTINLFVGKNKDKKHKDTALVN